MSDTFWNGEPIPARKVIVRVGKAMRPTWWCAAYEGDEREAVEVNYGGIIYLLDNENGGGWYKVTTGRGSPFVTHLSLPTNSEVLREALT